MPAARRLIKIGLVLALVATFVLSGTVWLPLYSLGPGPAREVLPLIRVSGHPEYGSSGRFVMTSERRELPEPHGGHHEAAGRSVLGMAGHPDERQDLFT